MEPNQSNPFSPNWPSEILHLGQAYSHLLLSQHHFVLSPVKPPTHYICSSRGNLPILLDCFDRPLSTLPEINVNENTFVFKLDGSWKILSKILVRRFMIQPMLANSPYLDLHIVPTKLLREMELVLAHLPNLDDLHSFNREVVAAMEAILWLDQLEGGEVLEEDAIYLVHPAPVFHPLKIIYRLTSQPSILRISSFSNTILFIEIGPKVLAIGIQVTTKRVGTTQFVEVNLKN